MATTRACLVALAVALAFLLLEGPTMAAALGAAGGSSEEHLRQVRSFLRRVNKAPVTSIQSPDGDIIDCVPISKQPAFDHPLLKNHTIQMQPSYHPRGQYGDSNIAPHPITQTWHQNGKCPENTVPIRRTKEEDVLRASSVNLYGKKRPDSIPNIHPEASVTSVHEYAVASLADGQYYGTQININLWKPMTETEDFSLTQLWTVAGSYANNDLNTIEVGWQVYQNFYGDNNPRLFIYWTRDAYRTTGCYNLGCSGFVQTNNQIAVGGTLSPQSVYGGSQYEICILVWKDPNTGNWWLQVGGTNVGYWPSSIFTHLENSASNVQWGGEVCSSSAGQTSTDMGSGHFPGEGFGKASYIRNIQVVDSSNYLIQASGLGFIISSTSPSCYNVQSGTSSNDWGTYIFYGGPGRNPNCP
ncbi:hypothetical protein SEVIR_8G228000v4 [Setaria viridis]|uniref:Neprosin PEP catalytic domain-containing protein n=1 Tax=Setaria viridis TaxID=4556 RepID=A0A4U6TIE1_SETVI|nr:uncharacterized protein LOC117833841 [Setaria viridis]TKW02168.1 hypothetical protein SEVIR_8G228000v2 [Setaria viridis]